MPACACARVVRVEHINIALIFNHQPMCY